MRATFSINDRVLVVQVDVHKHPTNMIWELHNQHGSIDLPLASDHTTLFQGGRQSGTLTLGTNCKAKI